MSITAKTLEEFKLIDKVMDILFEHTMEPKAAKDSSHGEFCWFSNEVVITKTSAARMERVGVDERLIIRGISLQEKANPVMSDRADVFLSYHGYILIDGEEVLVKYSMPVKTADNGCFVSINSSKPAPAPAEQES